MDYCAHCPFDEIEQFCSGDHTDSQHKHRSGDDYFLRGTEREVDDFTEALNYNFRDCIADGSNVEEYAHTAFAKCAQGPGLQAKLLNIFQGEAGFQRKELSFATVRDRRPQESADPNRRRMIVELNLDTWADTKRTDDISTQLIRGLVVLLSRTFMFSAGRMMALDETIPFLHTSARKTL